MFTRFIRRILPLIVWLCLPLSLTANAEQNTDVKETMRQALESLTYFIGFALDAEVDRSKDSEFQFNLERMQSLGSGITEHTKNIPYSLNLVTLTLDETIEQMVTSYQSGFDRSAETYLIETVDHCVACHTQSPNLKNNINVEALTASIQSEEVNTSVAARILIAARRIPEAIKIWEKRILSQEFSLDQPEAESMILEYIAQVLHLNEGLENLYRNLDELREKETTPYYFKRKLGIWIAQIKSTGQYSDRELTIDIIENLKDECVSLEGVSVRDEYLVCSLIVSSMSARMLRELPSGNAVIESRLYINMGVARLDSNLPTGYVPLVEGFLEAAIIAAPDSDVAREAYAHLEELAYFLYSDIDIAEEVMGVSFDGLKQLAGIN